MKFGKKYGIAAALVAVFAGVALSGVTPVPMVGGTDGWWVNVISNNSTADTGIVYSQFQSTTDSKVYGVGFIGATITGGANGAGNVSVASVGVGTPVSVNGSHSLSAGSTTRYLQRTDSSRITLTTAVYSDSVTGSAARTTWSSAFTGGTGYATETFFYANATGNFSTRTLAWDRFIANLNTLQTTDSLVLGTSNASVSESFVFSVDTVVTGDTARFIVVRPNGKVYETQALRVAGATSETFSMPSQYRLETGLNTVYAFYWNANESRLKILNSDIIMGAQTTAITAGSGGAAASNVTSAISQVALIVNSNHLYPQVGQVIITGVDAAGPRASDNFVVVDSNTSGFDTRMPNSVFEILVRDTAGNYITQLPTNQTFLVTVGYNFSGLSSSVASGLKLLRLNESTNSWEVVSNSSSDSQNSRIVGYLTGFSKYAIGNVSTSSAARVDDDDCAISLVAGKTGLQGILPSFRSVRDTLMGSVFGRLFVSGYYAFGMMMLVAAGLGVALAARR